MVNDNLYKGNWNELKGRIRSAWGKLTDDELETAKGDMQAVGGLIQKKYGAFQEDARKKLNDFFRDDTSRDAPAKNTATDQRSKPTGQRST